MSVLAKQSASFEHGSQPSVPRHVAIIMDGNGRWASARGVPRAEGHRRGVDAVRETIRAAAELGIKHLTLFGFSSENWSRPRDEIELLFGLLRSYIRNDLRQLDEAGARVKVIGRRTDLPPDIRLLIDEAERRTDANRRVQVNFAFNYGGRDEITRAVARIAAEAADGLLDPEAVNEGTIADHLDTASIPDPDLIIRTGGELRLSNFLLWQCAYSEFVFLPIYWPDFRKDDLEGALGLFEGRSRRYGGIGAR